MTVPLDSMTVGDSILPVSPIGAWVVVMSQSIVLFIFSSNELLSFVVSLGLPPYPLIPVSSSQAVIGAVIGIGISHGWPGIRQIKWRVLGNIGSGWISTPIVAAAISFIFLFFLQNVFQQQVFKEIRYQLSDAVLEHIADTGVAIEVFDDLRGQQIVSAAAFRDALRDRRKLAKREEALIIESAEIYRTAVTNENLASLDGEYLGLERTPAVEALVRQRFAHKWQLKEALMSHSDAWKAKEASPLTKDYNKKLSEMYDYLFRHLHQQDQ